MEDKNVGQLFDMFKQDKGNKAWFQAYENTTFRSRTTGWSVGTQGNQAPSKIKGGGSGSGRLLRTEDIGTSTGTLNVRYDMYDAPDRLQIINPNDGSIIFDTATLPESDGRGRVRGRSGSNQTITFNLGDGNTNVQIVINGGGGRRLGVTNFKFKLKVRTVNDDGNSRIINHEPK